MQTIGFVVASVYDVRVHDTSEMTWWNIAKICQQKRNMEWTVFIILQLLSNGSQTETSENFISWSQKHLFFW